MATLNIAFFHYAFLIAVSSSFTRIWLKLIGHAQLTRKCDFLGPPRS